jgi:tetratricopeptide (TPR) repeat protein
VPVFRPGASPEELPAPEVPLAAALDGGEWPLVFLGDFEAMDASPEQRRVATRMSDELALELGRYVSVHVLRQGDGNGLDRARRERARFGFAARLDGDGEALRMTAHLTDQHTGQEVWGDEYVTAPQPGRWSDSPEDVARVIAARSGAEEGVIVQHLAAERRTRQPVAAPHDVHLLSCEALFTRDRATFSAALTALRQLVKGDPGCGWAWTRLARLCLANLTFEVTALPTPLDEAVTSAQFGVRADPSNRLARSVLASTLLVKGELAAGIAELDQALRCSPDSLVYLEVVGHLLILLGDFERGRTVSRAALDRNPHCMPAVQVGLWFDHLRRGNVEQAYQAALHHRDPTFFMRSVMRASCLGLLGRVGDGRLEAARLLAAKPDFATRGRRLLGYYVKFPEVMVRIVDGLDKVGLRLD